MMSDDWNRRCAPAGCRVARDPSPERVVKLATAYRRGFDGDRERWLAFLDRIAASDWLSGKVPGHDGRPFAKGIAWFIEPRNREKILDGDFDNRPVLRVVEGGLPEETETERRRREIAERIAARDRDRAAGIASPYLGMRRR